jgi:hypothetical protein
VTDEAEKMTGVASEEERSAVGRWWRGEIADRRARIQRCIVVLIYVDHLLI